MIPKTVLLENFLSFGSPAVEIAFTDDEPLWVVGGPNGVGKSAIFDAITFALYGRHRGGKQRADQLIRHGANDLRVRFEFAIDRETYRVTRTARRGGVPTQRVEQLQSGEWRPVAGVNAMKDVEEWAERTLGLGCDAFEASVLLRQGNAEAIITATGAERLKILKSVIGAQRYEHLSKRVHDVAAECRSRVSWAKSQLTGKAPVASEEIERARSAVADTEAAEARARDEASVAAVRVVKSGEFEKLALSRKRVEALLHDAADRSARADRIRAAAARLAELTAVVPLVLRIIELRGVIARAAALHASVEQEIGERTSERDRLAAEVSLVGGQAEAHKARAAEADARAKTLRDESARNERYLTAAETIDSLQKSWEKGKSIPGKLKNAAETLAKARAEAQAAGNAKTEASTLHKQANERQKAFSKVGVGVLCSQCGQPVSAQHAAAESARIAADVARLYASLAAAISEETNAAAALRKATSAWEELDTAARERDVLASQLDAQKQTLVSLGITADASELRNQLKTQRGEIERLEKTARMEAAAEVAARKSLTRLDTHLQACEKRLAELTTKLREHETQTHTNQQVLESVRTQLPAPWADRVTTMDRAEALSLDGERQNLDAEGVVGLVAKLEEDEALRAEWGRQLAEIEARLAEIPEADRLPIESARAALATAEKRSKDSQLARRTAETAVAALEAKARDYADAAAAAAVAERAHDLHKKLDELLGKEGLQRELVRAAEREIVAFANDTVQQLSDGDLTVELEEAEGDSAFDLRVRRAADPTAIGVSYLSGSQKFRVAISVALAIGRYATGHSRRLESVIIDEGFGSLDRDGLRAAADELNRLRTHLKRIVLVSHQEEFADRFPVVIQLTPGENGTTARAVRR